MVLNFATLPLLLSSSFSEAIVVKNTGIVLNRSLIHMFWLVGVSAKLPVSMMDFTGRVVPLLSMTRQNMVSPRSLPSRQYHSARRISMPVGLTLHNRTTQGSLSFAVGGSAMNTGSVKVPVSVTHPITAHTDLAGFDVQVGQGSRGLGLDCVRCAAGGHRAAAEGPQAGGDGAVTVRRV